MFIFIISSRLIKQLQLDDKGTHTLTLTLDVALERKKAMHF